MDNESCSDSEIEVEVANDKATKSENIKNIQDACNNNSSSGSSNNAAPPTTTSPPTLVMGQQGPLGPALLGPRPRYPPTFSPVGPVPSSNPHPLLRQASFKQSWGATNYFWTIFSKQKKATALNKIE